MIKSEKAPVTYWLSRDRLHDGRLSEIVDVWLVRPERVPVADGAYYRLPGGADVRVSLVTGPHSARWARWSIDQCLGTCRVYPDDDRQVIVVGRPEEVAEVIRE